MTDVFAKGYYASVADRKNLTVLANAYVTEIVTMKDDNGKLVATGVRFLHGEEKKVYEAKASKEVCLSAGLVVLCVSSRTDSDQTDAAGPLNRLR